MVETIQIDPIFDSRWDCFVEQHCEAGVYHSSGWTRTLTQCFPSVRWKGISLVRDNGELGGVLPLYEIGNVVRGKRLEAAPLAGDCGPLTHDRQEREFLLKRAIDIMKLSKAKLIEIKQASPDDVAREVGFFEVRRFKAHVLRLDRSLEAIWKSLDRSCVRQRIRRAERSGLVIEEGKDESALKVFYDLLVLTRERKSLLPMPYEFLKSMWSSFGKSGKMRVRIARKGDKNIAGIILLRYKDCVIAEYAASDTRWRQFSANHLLFWRAIEDARSDGLQTFSFGRTAPGNLGLLEFKRRWGCEERDLFYYYYPEVMATSRLRVEDGWAKMLAGIICNAMPRQVRNSAGRLIYRFLL